MSKKKKKKKMEIDIYDIDFSNPQDVKVSGKKKNKVSKKEYAEELHSLGIIDKDIISQYFSLRDDIERFQYQLVSADSKTRKKYNKARRNGTKFDITNCDSVKVRKKIAKYMGDDDFLTRTIKLFEDVLPILRILGRCVGLLICAILSFDIVKLKIDKSTLDKMESLLRICTSV